MAVRTDERTPTRSELDAYNKAKKLTAHVMSVAKPKDKNVNNLKHPDGRVTVKRLRDKIRDEKRRLKRMKKKGIPLERVKQHYQSVRAGLKKGSRSDLHKMDRYYESLFGGEKP